MSDPLLVDRTGASDLEAEERFSAVWEPCLHTELTSPPMSIGVPLPAMTCASCCVEVVPRLTPDEIVMEADRG